MTALRVLYDHQAFLEQRFGGVSRYVVEVAGRVAQSPGYTAVISAGLHVNEYLVGAPVKVVGLKVPPVRRTVRLRALLNRAIDGACLRGVRPAIVHETYYREAAVRHRQHRTVVTIHDLIHERYPQYFPGDQTVARRKSAMQRADALVCVSHATKGYLSELYPQHAHKAVVIHHGQNFREPPKLAIDCVHRLTAGRPFLLYVGSRFGYKNFERMLRAFGALNSSGPDALTLLCFGGGAFTATELALAHSAGIASNRLVFTEGADSLLSAAYCLARAFVYPSLEEGFGIPLLEARAAGCPVACSYIPVFQEIMGDSVIYFDPRSIDSIVDALEAASSVERTRGIGSLLSSTADMPSWDNSASKHIALYTGLV